MLDTQRVSRFVCFDLLHLQPWRRLRQPMIQANAPCKVIWVLSLDPKCRKKQYAHLVFIASALLECVLCRD